MEKYNEFMAKARALKALGEYIISRKKELIAEIEWHTNSREEYLAECKGKDCEPSDWRIKSFDDDITDLQYQIKTLEKIEKILEKEMGI